MTSRVRCRFAAALMTLAIIWPAAAQAQTVTATWDPSPPSDSVTGYDVCIGTSAGSCNVRQTSVASPQVSFPFSPGGGVLHYVTVRAVNSNGTGPYASPVTFSIPGFAQPSNQTSQVGTAITPVTLSVVDPDGSTLSFTHTGLPVGLTINSSTRQITGTPSAAGTYNVTVFVTDGLVTVSRSFTWTITSPISLGLTPSVNSPQVAGTTVTFTASASGGQGPYQYKWWLYNGSTWTMVQNWGSATYRWTPTQANANYRIGVWARDSTTTADINTYNLSVTYAVTAAASAPASSALTLVLTSNLASPRTTGTSITFTASASGGQAPHQFKWWLYNGSTWTMVQNWGSATYTWTPTQANSNYRIGIWARDSTTTTDISTFNLSVPYVITAASSGSASSGPLTPNLTSNLASPQVTGTSITFTAGATGGVGPYQFKWWLYNGSTWTMVRDWGSATYTWTPTQVNANYRIGIWARESTTTADINTYNLSVPYVITGSASSGSGSSGPLTPNLTSNLASPQVTGTSITFTAGATGGVGPYQFKWWLYNGSTWTMVRGWGSATYTWTPTQANANYRIGIWARDSTTTADINTYNLSVPYAITTGSATTGPLTPTLTSNLPGGQTQGTSITFTAGATGGVGPYQFKWWLYNGSTWTMVRDWGSATYTWTPTQPNGNYRVGIWVRDSTTTADSNAYNLSIAFPIWID